MAGIIETLEKAFWGTVAFFAISGFVMLIMPDKKASAEEAAAAEETFVDIYPPVFKAALRGHDSLPTLDVDIGYKSMILKPLVKSHYKYEFGRLVYYADEADPIGFEMTVVGEDGVTRKAVFHRNRPKFHTWYKEKVHYGKIAEIEDVTDIIKKAGYNILCLDMSEK